MSKTAVWRVQLVGSKAWGVTRSFFDWKTPKSSQLKRLIDIMDMDKEKKHEEMLT